MLKNVPKPKLMESKINEMKYSSFYSQLWVLEYTVYRFVCFSTYLMFRQKIKFKLILLNSAFTAVQFSFWKRPRYPH